MVERHLLDFNKSKHCAYEFLLNQTCNWFPLDTNNLTLDGTKIIICEMREYEMIVGRKMIDEAKTQTCGFTSKKRGYRLIFKTDNIINQSIYWTELHEIGHVFLGHSYDNDKEEIETNFFVQQVSMPDCILAYLYNHEVQINHNTLKKYFGVSGEAANRTLSNFKPCKNSHKYDTYIVDKFSDYLNYVVDDYKKNMEDTHEKHSNICEIFE